MTPHPGRDRTARPVRTVLRRAGLVLLTALGHLGACWICGWGTAWSGSWPARDAPAPAGPGIELREADVRREVEAGLRDLERYLDEARFRSDGTTAG